MDIWKGSHHQGKELLPQERGVRRCPSCSRRSSGRVPVGGRHIGAHTELVLQGLFSTRRHLQAELLLALQRQEQGHVRSHCHCHSFGGKVGKWCLSKQPVLGATGMSKAEPGWFPPGLIPPQIQPTPPCSCYFPLLLFHLQDILFPETSTALKPAALGEGQRSTGMEAGAHWTGKEGGYLWIPGNISPGQAQSRRGLR